jgi:UDPglucose 6-dehydrogenase
LAWFGHHVTCVDTDQSKIDRLRAGISPIYEPGLEELMAEAAGRGGLDFTTSPDEAVRESDVIFIAVGTPSLPSGEANLAYLDAAARSIGAALTAHGDASGFRVIVNKSTVPVGSGNLVGALVREGMAVGRHADFGVASNPEFLREGSAIHDSFFPDRVVVGAEDRRTLQVMRELYRPLTSQEFTAPGFAPRPAAMAAEVPFVSTTLTSAEMIKYSANAFLATKIGFANEIANICEKVGADVTHVMQGIGLDSRIGSKFLNAGIGWGGSCFGKDIRSLLHTAGEYGYHARLLETSLAVNEAQRHTVIQKLQDKLKILKGRTIALLGLAFKPHTDDLRDAPSLLIAARLVQIGARVRAYDPVAMDVCRQHNPDLHITYCESAEDALSGADAAVLVTEWPQFAALDLCAMAQKMNRPVLVDGRNVFDPARARAAGFDYVGVGRPSPSMAAGSVQAA